MKKIKKTSELLWLLGTLFVALGVSICSKADLGVSMIAAPAFIVSEKLQSIWSGFTVGTVEYVLQGILLIILCILIRKFHFKYLLAFLVAIIYGYTLDLFLLITSQLTVNSIFMRYLLLIAGDVITACGVACFFHTYMPLQVYELFVAQFSISYKINIHKIKTVFDYSLLAISILLAFTLFGDVKNFDWTKITYVSFHSIGLGTIITTLINSPIIAFFSHIINKVFDATPLFPKLKEFLNSEQEDK